ncbi:hypothetical protein Tco_0581809 [Tanacetum coccineum]
MVAKHARHSYVASPLCSSPYHHGSPLAKNMLLRHCYDEGNGQETLKQSRALIDSFLKEGSDKDYELNLSMYEKAAKLEKLKDAKWNPNFTNENDPWEYSFDIDDSDLNITHVLRSSNSARVEPSPYTPTLFRNNNHGPAGTVQVSSSTCFEPSSSTPNPVRIIPGPAGLVQRAKQLKENVFILDPDGALMSTQEYICRKVVEDVVRISDFKNVGRLD